MSSDPVVHTGGDELQEEQSNMFSLMNASNLDASRALSAILDAQVPFVPMRLEFVIPSIIVP